MALLKGVLNLVSKREIERWSSLKIFHWIMTHASLLSVLKISDRLLKKNSVRTRITWSEMSNQLSCYSAGCQTFSPRNFKFGWLSIFVLWVLRNKTKWTAVMRGWFLPSSKSWVDRNRLTPKLWVGSTEDILESVFVQKHLKFKPFLYSIHKLSILKMLIKCRNLSLFNNCIFSIP